MELVRNWPVASVELVCRLLASVELGWNWRGTGSELACSKGGSGVELGWNLHVASVELAWNWCGTGVELACSKRGTDAELA